MSLQRIVGVAALLFAGSSCATHAPPPPADPPGTIASTPGAARTCPLGMAGTKIAVTDASDGVDVTFTTRGDIDELRRRVRDQGAEHGPGAHTGLGHGGAHTGAHTHGLRLWDIAPVNANATDVADGARIHITAKDPAEREHVRAALHERAAYIVALGDCP